MSFYTAESRALRGQSEGSDETRLRFHDSPVSAIKPPHFAELGSKDPEMLDVWSGLLDEFMDRSAVHRFQHYAANHAGYRWKPKLALVLPKRFSLGRPTHRRDLSVALEVLASVTDHYNIDVVSDSPDAARLFHKVVPFSHEAISASAARWYSCRVGSTTRSARSGPAATSRPTRALTGSTSRGSSSRRVVSSCLSPRWRTVKS